MKRINLMIIFIIGFIALAPSVYATSFYDKVSVKTSFEENINLENIEEIEVHLEDATEYSKDYILTKTNNYELTIEEVPVGPYKFIYGVVIGDEIGYYSVSATVNIDSMTNTVDVLVLVEESKTKTTSNNKLTEEDINKIKGITTKKTDDAGEIIIGDDDNEEASSGEETTTTRIPASIEEARIKEEKENQKKEKRKRNSLIGKIMFSIIGIVALGLVSYAAIKISNANK